MKTPSLLPIFFSLFLLSGTLFGQGIIVPEPPIPHPPQPPRVGRAELRAKKLKVDIQLVDLQVVTHLTQEFENPENWPIEGCYLLPLPEGAPISEFSMKINGKKVKGELLSASKARSLYEEILRKYRDPALLEYAGKALLKLSIFPIPPGGKQEIEIAYSREILPDARGLLEYQLPLSARPGVKLEELVISLDVQTRQDIRNVYSPTHPLEVRRLSARHYKGSLEMENLPLKGPFAFYVFLGEGAVGAHLFSWKKRGENGYFLLALNPSVDEVPVLPKDVVFVLDASGSMRDGKMEQAKRGLQLCLEQLGPKDRFEIIRFSTEADALFSTLQVADEMHLAKAKAYINTLEAMGGTNMDEALQKALSLAQPQRPLYVVLITDGKPTIGETDEKALVDKVLKNNDLDVRIFTIGVGFELNARLLDRLTTATRGFRTYVYEDEKLDFKLADFMQKVSAPVLTDLSWMWKGQLSWQEVYPKVLPDLFRGQSLILSGRYQGQGRGTLVLRGKREGKEEVFEFALDFPEEEVDYDFVPALWASRAVGYWLEQIRLHGEQEELIAEVVRLSKRYGIITPYTSYLILEDEQNLSFEERLHQAPLQQQLKQAEDYSPKEEYEAYRYSMGETASGRGSVQASDELQQLSEAENLAEAEVGRERLVYKKKEGETFNLADEVIRVEDRAFYHLGDWWIDARALESPWKDQEPKKIFLFSREFLSWLDAHPEYALLCSLNENVRLVVDGQLVDLEHPYE